MSRPLCTQEGERLPVVQEAGWAPGPVCTGAENVASTGIRSPDHVARSESLNTLRTGDADLRFYITTVQDG